MGVKKVFISICIPAYKRPENIRCLLKSISLQSYIDFEVVISDDSPDESVRSVLFEFPSLPIKYIKNAKPLGTPANWNYAISHAKGEWIKLMHDDDWFVNENSLREFAEQATSASGFIFSRYFIVAEDGTKKKSPFPGFWKKNLLCNPMILFARNVIGPPSVTMIHNSIKDQYDLRMKWRVDIDYYIQVLKKYRSYKLINQPLINIGLNSSQVTNNCIDKPEVELPEGLLLLYKHGISPLRNIVVYDAWWRIIRNVGVRNVNQLKEYTPGEKWPEVICRLVKHQQFIPVYLLNIGVISKLMMTISYLICKKFLKS